MIMRWSMQEVIALMQLLPPRRYAGLAYDMAAIRSDAELTKARSIAGCRR